MEVEYTFQNACTPFIHTYKLILTEPLDFSHRSFLNKLLDILTTEHVDAEQIECIKVYDESTSSWFIANDQTVPKELTKKLKLQIVLKTFVLEEEIRMKEQIVQMQEEVKTLQNAIQDFLNKQTKANIDETMLINDLHSLAHEDSSATIEMTKSASAIGTLSPNYINKNETDIVYLYSVPLVKEEVKSIIPLSNPLDAYKEITGIIESIKNDNKSVTLKIGIGTFDRLRNAISTKPKILHLVCSGGYEMEDDMPKLYIYLERNELNGVADKYDVDSFKQWFAAEIENIKQTKPRLVIINACYAKELGEAIRQAGVMNVIAVDHNTQESDEVAQRFVKILYHYLTIGRSIKEAFEKTKEDVKVSIGKYRICCCTHSHKKNCGLLEELIRNREEAHAKHVAECVCSFDGNIHSKSCRWAASMNELSYEIKPVKDNPRKVGVCCCNPDLPHNEEEKFALISQDIETQNERLFLNIDGAEPLVMRSFNPQVLPILDEEPIGRNINIYELLAVLISTSPESHIISVSGKKGLGKTFLVKTTAKYAIERGFFPNGIVTAFFPSLTWLLSNLNSSLLPPPHKEAKDLSELGQRIKHMQKLVIMQCYSIEEKNLYHLVKAIRAILNEGSKSKFVILARKNMNTKHVVSIEIKSDLDPLSIFMIIKRRNPEWKHTFNYFETTDLATILNTPWLAKKAARMLKTDSADEVYLKLSRENQMVEVDNSNEESMQSEEELFKSLRESCEEMTPIYILAQLQFGVFEGDFQEICKEEFSKWKDKAKHFITEATESQMIIRCTRNEDLKENLYKLTEAAVKYVNKYLLTSNERAQYLMVCLETLSKILYRIVWNYKVNIYKQISYNDFSAMIDEGIWESTHTSREPQRLLPDFMIRFQAAKDNFRLFLDVETLGSIIPEVCNVDLGKVMKNIKKLAVCMFTMLLHLDRPQEAMGIADSIQAFAYTQANLLQNVKYKRMQKHCYNLIGMMQLMKGGMFFKSPDVIGSKEALKQAEEAESAFKSSENELGIGEALFLQGLVSALDQNKKKYTPAIFQEAKSKFNLKTYGIGIVRVNIAETSLLASSITENDYTGYIEELLNKSLEILSEKVYYENMEAECYYIKAVCAGKHKDYNLLKEIVLIALEKCHSVSNKIMEAKCIELLNESSMDMQRDYPRFVFLKSMPIVRKTPEGEIQALELPVQGLSFFMATVLGYFENEQKAIKAHFDILTRENLRQAMLKGCAVLQITPGYWSEDTISFEGSLGELDEVPLDNLGVMLSNYIRVSQCKVVVIMTPHGQKIGKVFADLGIPHVVCFSFSAGELAKCKEVIVASNIPETFLFDFTTEFHRLLIRNETVKDACEKASTAAEEKARVRLEQAKLDPSYISFKNRYLILPADSNNASHAVKVFPELRPGKFIETSPKRGTCDIEYERMALVGRQVEFFKLATEIFTSKCVNLYGHKGVGKTKLVKDLAYFLYVRLYFLSGIYYREGIDKIYNPKSFVPLGDNQNGDYSTLIIVDKIEPVAWRKAMYFFQSLGEEYKYLFLFVSREPLEHNPGFNIVKQRLKPLNENESIELILTHFAENRAKVHKNKRKSLLNRKKLKEKVLNSLAFRQTHGYPRLLHLLSKRIAKGVDVLKIDLLNEPKLDPYFKEMIMNYEMSEGDLKIIPKMEYAHSSNLSVKTNSKEEFEDFDSDLFSQFQTEMLIDPFIGEVKQSSDVSLVHNESKKPVSNLHKEQTNEKEISKFETKEKLELRIVEKENNVSSSESESEESDKSKEASKSSTSSYHKRTFRKNKKYRKNKLKVKKKGKSHKSSVKHKVKRT